MTTRIGKTHVLAVGISEYCEKNDCLKYSRSGVTKLLEIITSKYMVDVDDVYPLYDEAATLEAIVANLCRLESLPREDSVVIILSGHAKVMRGDWYFVPHDASLAETHYRKLLSGHDLLVEHLKAIQCSHIFVIVDACFGGILLMGDVTQEGVSTEQVVLQALMSPDRPSRYVFVAGDASEAVRDGGGHESSIFLEEIGRHLDLSPDSFVSASALVERVKHTVQGRLVHSPVPQHPTEGYVVGANLGTVFCFRKRDGVIRGISHHVYVNAEIVVNIERLAADNIDEDGVNEACLGLAEGLVDAVQAGYKPSVKHAVQQLRNKRRVLWVFQEFVATLESLDETLFEVLPVSEILLCDASDETCEMYYRKMCVIAAVRKGQRLGVDWVYFVPSEIKKLLPCYFG